MKAPSTWLTEFTANGEWQESGYLTELQIQTVTELMRTFISSNTVLGEDE